MTAALPALGALPAVDLGELVDRAALQTRVDRKYVVPLATADALVAALAGAARALELDGQRSFAYASVYDDTAGLTSYHLAARGRRRRFKVRRRTYLDSGQTWVEVKTRGTRGSTVKQRAPYAGPELLSAGGRGFVAEALARAGVTDVSAAGLAPVLRTHYRRSTLLLPASGSRVTLDVDLAWSLPNGGGLRLDGHAVVETKSGSAASLADRQLWALGCRPCRVSKYATGLAVLRPDLPSHRWHPVMRRHFPLPAASPSRVLAPSPQDLRYAA